MQGISYRLCLLTNSSFFLLLENLLLTYLNKHRECVPHAFVCPLLLPLYSKVLETMFMTNSVLCP